MRDRSNTPRVCLIGTSNAVYGSGYASALNSYPGFAAFQAHALGHSGSGLFAFWQDRIDFADYDVCILDFACNDARELLDGAVAPDTIVASITHAIGRITQSGCMPVLLIYPILDAMPDGGQIREAMLGIAETCRIPVFDVYRYLHRMFPGETESLFLDPMHLALPIAWQVGEALARTVNPVWRAWAQSRSRQEIAFDGCSLRYIPAPEIAAGHGPVVERATSLLSCKALDIPARDSVMVRIGADAELVAVAVDLANSRTDLLVCGLTRATVCSAREMEPDSRKRLVFALLPCHPVPAVDGFVRLEPMADDPAGDSVGTAVIGLVVRQPSRVVVRTGFSHAVALCASAGEHALESVCAAVSFAGSNASGCVTHGWSYPEPQIRWTSGRRSGLSIEKPRSAGRLRLRLMLAPFVVQDRVARQRLSIMVNGVSVGEYVAAESYLQFVDCDISAAVPLSSRHIHFRFHHPDAARPADIFGNGDARALAFAFRRLEIVHVAAEESDGGAVPMEEQEADSLAAC